jgi:hypothetical protein
MSDLTFAEKRKFEQFLGMSSGYVLDFTNRTFADFVLDSTGRDIYDSRYDNASGSKAHRLRAFWQKEDNRLVAKLMGDMLNYSGDTGATAELCRLIVGRLLGTPHVAVQVPEPERQPGPLPQQSRRLEALLGLKEEFVSLAAEKDRSKAGLALEKLLNRLFELYELKPRNPFRVVGEQIDGSFDLDSHIYLLELKWEQHPLPEADLLVFRGKIEGKSTFTRGVFIALNGISHQARDAITRGKSPSFFVMDGHDLMMILSDVMTLPDFLRKRVRLLAEEGRMCVSFGELP